MGSHEGNEDTGPDGALHQMLDMIITGERHAAHPVHSNNNDPIHL